MATSTGGHTDESIGALLDRFFSETIVDDIVQYNAAVRMNGIENLGACTERGNNNRHLVLYAKCDVLHQSIVGIVNNLIHCKRCSGLVGVRQIVRIELCIYLR